MNPNKREYSCFSNTHKTYSRIDYFIVSSNLLSKIERCWYDSILLSDHAPISLTMQFSNLKPTPFRFRFQTSWLQSSKFVDFLDKKIEEYFSINTDQTSASTKWEAFKAHIRGEIMSYTSRKSKEYYTKLGDLDQQIKELEIELIENNDPENKKKLISLKAQYNELTSNKIATNLMWLKQSYYDQGEKPGKLLAWRIKKIQTNRAINSILLVDGQASTDPLEINNALKLYYENVYTSECLDTLLEQNNFLDELEFPQLAEDAKLDLENNLSIEELVDAVQSMNSGKAPGPDGLPVEIYKNFSKRLMPHLLEII